MTAVQRTRPARTVSPAARRRSQERTAYLFLSPWLIGLIGIVIGPILYSLYLSFTRYNLLSKPHWIGIRNFVNLTLDPQYLQAVSVTLTFVLISVPLILLLSLALALFLNKGIRFLRLYRTLFYLPSLLGTSVAVAVLWLKVFGQPGLLNNTLHLFGITGPSWIGSPYTALYTVVALNLWAFGSTMVIFLAGLGQVPKEFYEAAQIDGAGWWSCLWHATLPWISPLIFFNLILDVIAAFQTFTSAFVIGGGTGQPAGSLLFYSVYLYLQGFTNFKMGYASAMAWVMFVTLSAFSVIAFLTAKYWVHYGGDQ
jgi:ABC-type sugar transport system permease subunit